MENVCIVCNRAIEHPRSRDEHEEEHAEGQSDAAVGDRRSSNDNIAVGAANGGVAAGKKAAVNDGGEMHRTRSTHALTRAGGTAGRARAGGGVQHHHHHHHHQHVAKIRRNHSSTKVASAAARHAAAQAAAGAPGPSLKGRPESSSDRPNHETNGKGKARASLGDGNGIGDGNGSVHANDEDQDLPDWMDIYCSDDCRQEDEFRSRLALASLEDERDRLISSGLQHSSSYGSSVGYGPAGYPSHPLSSTAPMANGYFSSAPPHRISTVSISGSQRSASPSSPGLLRTRSSGYTPSSPLANDSDGSEYDWQSAKHQYAGSSSRLRSPVIGATSYHHRPTSSQEGASYDAASRRYSDGSESSSRLSLSHRPRRSSSRIRGSTDSLASLSEEDYPTSPTSASGPSRPELSHRGTSALSNGLRAMTPIHQTFGSSPRGPRSSTAGPPQAEANVSNSMIRSNSDYVAGPSSNINSIATTLVADGSVASAKTFRPSSFQGRGLMPSKSSTTLAISSATDVRATLSAASEADDSNSQARRGSESTSSASPSFKAPHPSIGRPQGASARPRPRSHHASSGSIPYLSCSPSSPGSVVSMRSSASTAPSTSSARGEPEDPHSRLSTTKSSRKISAHFDERERRSSLASYGLFSSQRTPSTPSLTSLAAMSGGSYGLSPPGPASSMSRAARLSSSFDVMHSAMTGGRPLSASLGRPGSALMSPRRTSFDPNGSESHLHPGHHAGTTENTPTQSLSTSRSQSYLERHRSRSSTHLPAHEIMHLPSADVYGRQRAPSITRTDLERVASDRSLVSSNSSNAAAALGQVAPATRRSHPPHLRPNIPHLQSFDGSDASGSSPPSPALPTPGREERGYTQQHRQPSHPSIAQLQHEELGKMIPPRAFAAGARNKSGSSFTWDHLPHYIPTYAALDLDKIRRNKSGTSLHSLPEDEVADPAQAGNDSQITIKRSSPAPQKKRLFYFPDES